MTEKTSPGSSRNPRMDPAALKDFARHTSFYEFAKGLLGPIAASPGGIYLATGCTWQTISDGYWWQDYRINNTDTGTGDLEVEVDGTVVQTLSPGQSCDVTGRKIRVHAPQKQTVSTNGTYDRL